VNFLAIDASTEACSVAIKYQDKVYSEFELCPQSHSLVLLPMVDRLLKQAGCLLSDFDALIYGQGPGSFTGVRIGIGVAQGLAFAAELPTIGISTLQTMAQQAIVETENEQVLVAIDARMSEIYTARFIKNEQGFAEIAGKEMVIAPEYIASALSLTKSVEDSEYYVAGTGWQAYYEALKAFQLNSTIDIQYPDAKHMLALGQHYFEQGLAKPAEEAQPVYVRDTVSWKKLPGRE